MTIEITDANFEAEVINSDKPILVDFWAEWCGPCKAMEPILDQVSEEMAATLRIGKVDADVQQNAVQQFNIMSIPTMILFVGGQPVDQIVGAMPKEVLVEKLNAALAQATVA